MVMKLLRAHRAARRAYSAAFWSTLRGPVAETRPTPTVRATDSVVAKKVAGTPDEGPREARFRIVTDGGVLYRESAAAIRAVEDELRANGISGVLYDNRQGPGKLGERSRW